MHACVYILRAYTYVHILCIFIYIYVHVYVYMYVYLCIKNYGLAVAIASFPSKYCDDPPRISLGFLVSEPKLYSGTKHNGFAFDLVAFS